MNRIFIVSSRDYSGKTLVCLGLAMKLMQEGYKVGYIKPFGKTPLKRGRGVFDADAVFVKEALALKEPLEVISPFVFTYEVQNLLLKGKVRGIKKQVASALRSIKNKDFLIIAGDGDFFEGTALGIDAMSLMDDIKGTALMVEAWRGDASLDSLLSGKRLFGKGFTGAVINKVPHNSLGHVREALKPFMEKKGVRVFGVLPKDSLLESITVRHLNEILNGKVLCREDRLDEFVENFSIGAMDVDSALRYFRRTPNKAVITGAHRSDIQLAAMETSTKCIILTGGLYTNDVVIGRAQLKAIPVISVAEDTFTVIDRIEAVFGKTRIRERGKITRAKELIDAGFDMKGFLNALK